MPSKYLTKMCENTKADLHDRNLRDAWPHSYADAPVEKNNMKLSKSPWLVEEGRQFEQPLLGAAKDDREEDHEPEERARKHRMARVAWWTKFMISFAGSFLAKLLWDKWRVSRYDPCAKH
jgi:hypothetical protein